jgi:hypothetical protein
LLKSKDFFGRWQTGQRMPADVGAPQANCAAAQWVTFTAARLAEFRGEKALIA